MNKDIDLYEYINKWVGNSTIYPYYKIDAKIDFVSNLISSHPSFKNISIVPSGAKRNRTAVNYMEYLTLYLILDEVDNKSDTRKFKSSIFDIINKNNSYPLKINEISYYLILEYENEKMVLLPSFKNIDENNIEGALITNSDGINEIFYPKLDNKNFDKKEQDCGANFINLIKIFKYIFLTFSNEIKSMNELSPNIIEALVWNLPNQYFKFNDYDEAILKSIDYIYEKIASEDYMSLSEINDIKVLFSVRNNLHRKEILQALYKIKQIILQNI